MVIFKNGNLKQIKLNLCGSVKTQKLKIKNKKIPNFVLPNWDLGAFDAFIFVFFFFVLNLLIQQDNEYKREGKGQSGHSTNGAHNL